MQILSHPHPTPQGFPEASPRPWNPGAGLQPRRSLVRDGRVGGFPTNARCPPPAVSTFIWGTRISASISLGFFVSLQGTFKTSSKVYMGPFQRTNRKPQQAAGEGKKPPLNWQSN